MNLQGRDLKLDLSGDDVKLLHTELAQLSLTVTPAEELRAFFGPATREAVVRFQQAHRLPATGVVDTATAKAINQAVDALNAETYVVSGRVTSPDRAGVSGLKVQIVDKNLGQDVPLVEAVTDQNGHYQAQFSAGVLAAQHKTQPDLQAHVYSGTTPLASSQIRYNANHNETLDVALPANSTALPSEYESLTAALAAQYGGPLGDLVESTQRQDITYLANKTGWDARLIAMAALADQFSRQNTPSINAAFYFALFRGGLPTTVGKVYQVDPAAAGKIWQLAITQGVIPTALQAMIPNAVEAFQKLVAAHALDIPAPAGMSTVKQLAQLALGDDPNKQQQFATLYAQYRSDWPTFWKAAQQAFGEVTTKRLQLDGSLGVLTLGNAPLIAQLHAAEQRSPLSSTSDLAARGYYSADKWNGLLAQAPIPDSISGDTVDAKRANYSNMLAAQVRLQFPTAVVAAQVGANEIQLSVTSADVRDAVRGFLTAHQGKFEIGKQPVEQYLVRNKLSGQVSPAVTAEIQRIQRVYQITPSDQSMIGLLKKNVHSAYQIARFDEEEFVRGFKEDVGGEDTARLVWSRARQVHNAVLNIATHYVVARTAPQIGVHSPGQILDQTPDDSNTDVVAYPTLEKLFVSMDYCSCDHCRSILSPAAYLVDLLHFIDKDPPDNNPDNKKNPQAVLFDRRPDIQYLKLTCENTNTPLPYIDIVNETLEYFVANASLANFIGHDTDGSAQPAELLASPQFVDDTAYETVRTAIFPPPLPFNKSLETLRRYFDKFGAPLHEAMKTLRATDALERANDSAYGWRDILMERLGLSREEYRLLTDQSLTVRHLYGYSDLDTDASVPSDLAKIETFARRIGVSYAELIAILETHFINPASTFIPRIEQLGVPFSALRDLQTSAISNSNFGKLLPRKLDPAVYGGTSKVANDGSNYDQVMGDTVKAWLGKDNTYNRIMALITVANPTNNQNLCDVKALEFRYANPDTNANTLAAVEYVRLIRFIRLWRKLGWTIAQTDAAITALFPPDPQDGKSALDHLDAGFSTFLPRLGVLMDVIDHLHLNVDHDLLGLLACWSPIETHGNDSLYRRMFLSPALLKQDPVFGDDGFGDVLQDATKMVVDHIEALRAAFGLTGDEISLIADEVVRNENAANPPPNPLLTRATLPLTLLRVSAIYRHGWLSRRLSLSVREFVLLKEQTGIDPFAAPDPVTPAITQFLEFLDGLRRASIKPTQALYLMWDQDLSGKSAPDNRHITDLARTLRADFAAVESDFAIVDDPNGDIARARMVLVYGTEATDFFFGLLNNTFIVTANYTRPPAASPQPLVAAAPGRIVYDDFAKRLSFAGYLDLAMDARLITAADKDPDLTKAVSDLEAASKAAVDPFLARYPELKPLLDAYAAAPPTDSPEKKRTTLLASFLPGLKRLRKREQALAAVSAAARADITFASGILDDAHVLNAAADTALTALDDFTACEVVPGETIGGAWSGFLDATETGLYEFKVNVDAGITAVKLIIDGTDALMAAAVPGAWTNGAPITLTAGRLASFSLTVTGAGALKVQWMTKGHGWEEIPAENLYPAATIDRLSTTYIRFLKVNALASALKLTAHEIAYLASRDDLRINLPPVGLRPWLNALPVSTNVTAAVSTSLLDRLIAVSDFAWFKAGLSPGDERLLGVFQDPASKLANGESLLLTLSNWDADSLTATLARLGKAPGDLSDIETFRRVYESFALARKVGISASALVKATTNNPDPIAVHTSHVVRDFESALRARYDAAAWLEVLQPINDVLRKLRRDALVAYVLQQFRGRANSDIDTPDKLFEYFLMDVEMDACMQTSRIRHALSSVQLFIERCLMNLERNVEPSTLNAKQWEWMRRYRVWEANRKVFLWPENWLEPELRDHQSPIFKETMSELLQSDITEDSAEVALLNYLAKLEEVAKLEPCGVHYEDANNVHVVARTAGAHRKYYYRRMEEGSWLPWEQIKLEIEDNPIIPVVWKGRLLLLWLKILKMGPRTAQKFKPNQDGSPPDLNKLSPDNLPDDPPVTVKAMLCWSEHYNGKWQPAKTSNVDQPAVLLQWDYGVEAKFTTTSFDRSTLRLGVGQEGDALRVFLSDDPQGEISFWTSFLLYNTHSLPEPEDVNPADPRIDVSNGRALDTSKDVLTIRFEFVDPRGYDYGNAPSTEDVLKSLIPSTTRTAEPLHSLGDWNAPFFYADGRHVFYVTPTNAPITVSDPGAGSFGPIGIAHLVDGVVNRNGIDRVIHRPGGDPSPMARLSADANINHIAPGTRTVGYGTTMIGVSGGLINQSSNIVR